MLRGAGSGGEAGVVGLVPDEVAAHPEGPVLGRRGAAHGRDGEGGGEGRCCDGGGGPGRREA